MCIEKKNKQKNQQKRNKVLVYLKIQMECVSKK